MGRAIQAHRDKGKFLGRVGEGVEDGGVGIAGEAVGRFETGGSLGWLRAEKING